MGKTLEQSVAAWQKTVASLPESVTKVGCEAGEVRDLKFSREAALVLKRMVCDPLYIDYDATGIAVGGWVGELREHVGARFVEGHSVDEKTIGELLAADPQVIEWEAAQSQYRLTDAAVDFLFVERWDTW